MNDRREAAGRTNAPETGRPSVNNGLEVGRVRGPGEGCGARTGCARGREGRRAAGCGACASRQLLRARDRAPRAHRCQCIGVDSAPRTPLDSRDPILGDSDTVLCVTGAVLATSDNVVL